MPTTKVYGSQIKEQTIATDVFAPNSINGAIIVNNSITAEKLIDKYSLFGHTHEGAEIISKVLSAENADYVDWSGVLNKPNFADASWKGVKANRTSVPLVGNSIGDTLVIVDDGDGKGALYVCKAISGGFDNQWGKQGDVDFSSPDWSVILNKPTTVDGYGINDASKLGHKHTKSEITDFPTTMTPSSHNHVGSDITTAVANALHATSADTATTATSATTATTATSATTAGSCTGNSATATKLITPRTINGVSFDGSANITITATANGGTSSACSGNAATATTATTAYNIPVGDVGGNIWMV